MEQQNKDKLQINNLFETQMKDSKKFSVSIKIKKPSSKKDEGEKQ